MAADVVVVGGGFTGLSAALHLACAGKRVIVVEAAEPGWGASGRNGGQIIAGIKAGIDELAPLFGEALARRTVLHMAGSADLVFALIARHGIDCHAVPSGWLQAAHGPKPYRDLILPRHRQWTVLGVAAELLDAAETARRVGAAPDAYVGGWFDPRGGTLQPLSYARGLAAAALGAGAAIRAGTRATGLRREAGIWELATSGGTIRAPQVVLATNAYTGTWAADLWPGLARTVIPVASFQMATPPLTGRFDHILPGGIGVTDSRRLLLYFRRDHTGRLIMGGRSPGDEDPVPADAAPLQRAIRRIFPELGTQPVDYIWSGKVAISKDKLPHIHQPAEGVSVFMGCNGRGVAACTSYGALLADLALGMPPGDLPFPVSAPDSFSLHRLRKLGIFALAQYYRLLDALESRG
jgi:glycine/D-amino acid oxidase-like deaminating enzyme